MSDRGDFSYDRLNGDDGGRLRAYGDAPPGPADRLPPHNIEAEAGLLGSVILDDAVLDEVVLIVKAEDFYRERHQTVFRAAVDLRAGGRPVGCVTLMDELERRGELARVGGMEFLAELAAAAPHALHARYFADIVRQKAISRRLIECARGIERDGYSNNFTAEQLLDSAESRVLSIADAEASVATVRVDSVMPAVVDAVRRRQEGDFDGLTTGLCDFDYLTCGLQPENLIYLAGRTSMGKTAYALNLVEHVVLKLRAAVLFASLEMSRMEIGERLAIARSRVDGHLVKQGKLNPAERARFAAAAAEYGDARLFIDDSPGRTLTQLAANARRFRSREGIALYVLDLVNHVQGENKSAPRREQLNDVSRRLKGLGRELKIPVLVLAQLNRGPEGREGNRPRMSDLKETGNFEEDADLVVLLHRPEYYDPNDSPGRAVVVVDKNRNGPTGDVHVAFDSRCMKFESLARPGYDAGLQAVIDSGPDF